MGNSSIYITKEIVKFCSLMDSKGFTANHDGNISTLIGNEIIATPTAESKGLMTPEMIIKLDNQGKKISGLGKPFSEIKLHLAAYSARSDALAVMHAHPPFATARGLVQQDLIPSLPEAIVSLGDKIPVIDFAMPGTKESEEYIYQAFLEYDSILIPGNGVLTIGQNLEQAWLRLELVEHLAKIEHLANSMGTQMKLSQDQINLLLQKRKAAGLSPKLKEKAHTLEDVIASEIKKELLGINK